MRKLKARSLMDAISKLYKELNKHQDKCKHLKKTSIDGGDTGNWCPQDDCYWTDYSCPTCLKTWRVIHDNN